MNTTRVRTLAISCGVGLLACSIYTEDLLEDGVGGNGVSCREAAECPGLDTTCGFRTCDMGLCNRQNAASGSACTEDGGKVCDGNGRCVECTTELDCMPGQSCSADNVCIEGKAADGAPCATGDACQSGNCVDGRCCESSCGAVCRSCAEQGMEGSCVPVPDGADPDGDCGADRCNGAGACRCNDGMVSAGETDVDCGGGVCMDCADGMGCMAPTDCISGFCINMSCASPGCGDMSIGMGEECDDGNTVGFDGCSKSCLFEADHLLISEVVATPTLGEMVEIYNPSTQTVSLADVYLADYDTYYLVTQGGTPTATDFVVRFPNGASIGPRGFVVVAIQSATEYASVFMSMPDYDLGGISGVPGMVGNFTASTGLTNDSEMVVLFRWNGTSDLVQDHDYVTWGTTVSSRMDKSGVMVGTGTYLAETPELSQTPIGMHASGESLHRCDTAESTEIQMGSNGITGHDETSEDFLAAWVKTTPPSPKAAPAPAACP